METGNAKHAAMSTNTQHERPKKVSMSNLSQKANRKRVLGVKDEKLRLKFYHSSFCQKKLHLWCSLVRLKSTIKAR